MWCYSFIKQHLYLPVLLLFACSSPNKELAHQAQSETKNGVELIVLGNVQDAGSPHIACKKACCKDLFLQPDPSRKVVSLGLIDHKSQRTYLFEASPDIAEQLKLLKTHSGFDDQEIPNGIFLTHAHIGHYTGLMYLGKEATNAKAVNVFAMPKMAQFLKDNGPWSQLVSNDNISLKPLFTDSSVNFNHIKITPFIVPHRDEYSETVGYRIDGPNKSVLFIPDIDKWSKWAHSIKAEIAKVDYAFLDGTFYDGEEINTRDISEIPHPFVIESMELFKSLSLEEKNKIHFIHFNHTNPLLVKDSKQSVRVLKEGFNIAPFLFKVAL